MLLKHDIENIAGNWDKAVQYGTCYCLIKPKEEWINPRCTENVVGNCDTGDSELECTTERHHHAMTFATAEGDKEGLTMLSTLLCYRGGIITIEKSGQNAILIDQRYIKILEIAREHRENKTLEEEKLDFVQMVFPMLITEERRCGIPAELMFAQMCLESYYGQKAVGGNYFGIKGTGTVGSVNAVTNEEINGNSISISDDFRAYNSMKESIGDYIDLLTNDYKQYTSTGTIEDWCDALVIGGYATDSKYKSKILGVCRRWGLIEEEEHN